MQGGDFHIACESVRKRLTGKEKSGSSARVSGKKKVHDSLISRTKGYGSFAKHAKPRPLNRKRGVRTKKGWGATGLDASRG